MMFIGRVNGWRKRSQNNLTIPANGMQVAHIGLLGAFASYFN